MKTKQEICELLSNNDQTALKKLIEKMETQVGEVISDTQYRTVWMPCPPLEAGEETEATTSQDEGAVEEASS